MSQRWSDSKEHFYLYSLKAFLSKHLLIY